MNEISIDEIETRRKNKKIKSTVPYIISAVVQVINVETPDERFPQVILNSCAFLNLDK